MVGRLVQNRKGTPMYKRGKQYIKKCKNTQNRKQHIQNKQENKIERIIRENKTINWNITRSKMHKAKSNQTTTRRHAVE
jgi:hypothetical protein